MIRKATTDDAEQIARIYNHYVDHTIVTFDLEPVTAEYFETQITERLKRFTWLVYEYQGQITAYAYASPWNSRAAYKHCVELSIYADEEYSGRGHGVRLYKQLIADLKEMDFHIAIGGISLPNDASVRLHEAFGFKKCAHFSEVGRKFGKWIDVGYWELQLSDSDGIKGSE